MASTSSVQRRVVKALANKLSGGKQDARCVGRQCIQIGYQRSTLLLGHLPMQDERWRLEVGKRYLDGIKVLCALCQDHHLATLGDGITDLGSNRGCAIPIVGQMPKDILNTGVGWYIYPPMA